MPGPDRRGEEGLPGPTGPSPSWPQPARLGRLCRGAQQHSSSAHSRPRSFWAAITAPLKETKRPDVRGVATPAARPPEERVAAQSANPKLTLSRRRRVYEERLFRSEQRGAGLGVAASPRGVFPGWISEIGAAFSEEPDRE